MAVNFLSLYSMNEFNSNINKDYTNFIAKPGNSHTEVSDLLCHRLNGQENCQSTNSKKKVSPNMFFIKSLLDNDKNITPD